jgi:hypothetical protein
MNFNGQLQDQISDLPELGRERYENIFNVYTILKNEDSFYYYYNILNKVVIPESIDENIFDTITLNRRLPWTTFSYNLYQTMNLWWLLFLINKPKNIFVADAGIEYKYIREEYIDRIINDLNAQINT